MVDPKPMPKGERYYKVFHCHGCQTCFEMVGDKLVQHPHILSQVDVTDEITALKAQQK